MHRELNRALDMLNLSLTQTEVDWIFDEFGSGNSDAMSYRKFVEFVDGN